MRKLCTRQHFIESSKNSNSTMIESGKILRVYREMEISFEELEKAMTRLGFHKKSERSRNTVKEALLKRPLAEITFFMPEKNIAYVLYEQPAEVPVPKREIVKISTLVNYHDIIKHFDDLVNMVEKEHLKQQATA